MKKSDYLELLMLLSALESWAFNVAQTQRARDWLHDKLSNNIDMLKKEVLELEEEDE